MKTREGRGSLVDALNEIIYARGPRGTLYLVGEDRVTYDARNFLRAQLCWYGPLTVSVEPEKKY